MIQIMICPRCELFQPKTLVGRLGLSCQVFVRRSILVFMWGVSRRLSLKGKQRLQPTYSPSPPLILPRPTPFMRHRSSSAITGGLSRWTSTVSIPYDILSSLFLALRVPLTRELEPPGPFPAEIVPSSSPRQEHQRSKKRIMRVHWSLTLIAIRNHRILEKSGAGRTRLRLTAAAATALEPPLQAIVVVTAAATLLRTAPTMAVQCLADARLSKTANQLRIIASPTKIS